MQQVRWQQNDPMITRSGSWAVITTYWKGIVAIVLICTLGMFVWSLLQPKVHTATATGVVVVEGAQDIGDALSGVELAEAKAASYESFGKSEPVTRTVIETLELDIHHTVLSDQIEISKPENGAEVHITAEGGTPEEAVVLADAWVEALAAHVNMLDDTDGDPANAPYQLQLRPLTNASERFTPESPRVGSNVVLGLLIGLIIGLVYAFTRYRIGR